MEHSVKKILDNPKLAFLTTAAPGASGYHLPAARAGYRPQLFTAGPPSKGETDQKKWQYGVSLLVPAEFDLGPLKKRIEELFEENVPVAKRATTKWRSPIIDTASDPRMAGLAELYPYMLRPNSKLYDKNGGTRARPGVVDIRGKAVDEEPELLQAAGVWLRASVQPYWYPANQGSAGVSLGLQNVQILWSGDKDTKIEGARVSAENDFAPIDIDDEVEVQEEYA